VSPGLKRLWAGLLLILAVWAVFGQVGDFPFLGFDDDVYVTDNRHVQNGMSREGLAWAVQTTRSGHWHPLTWLSHMLDIELFGPRPGAHHTTNLLLHLANALLLLHVLNLMTGAFARSLLVAALFALHPLHAESVAWVADRKDLLCALFMLLSLWSYARYGRGRSGVFYGLALSAFALALMAKAMAVTLPLLMLLLDRWPLARPAHDPLELVEEPVKARRPAGWGRLFLEKVPFLALALGAALAAAAFMGDGGGGSAPAHSMVVRLQAALEAYAHYMVKTVLPADLAVHYTLSPNAAMWVVGAEALLFTGFTVAAIGWRDRIPYLFTGWFWFVIGIAPVSGLVYLGVTPMADRYAYMPLVGLFIAGVWGAADAMKRFHSSRSRRAILVGLGIVLLVSLGMVCRRQVGYWRDGRTLFERAVHVSPASALAHNNLGLEMGSLGDTPAALRHFSTALRLDPRMADAHRNRGIALARAGRIQEASTSLETAIRLQPDDAEPRSYLARCYLVQGRFQEAEAMCRKALELEPGHGRALVNLGEALLCQGRPKEAEAAYRQGLGTFDGDRVRPLSGLATTLAAQGRLNEAAAIRRRLVSMRPDSGEQWYRLAVETFLLGDPASARRYCDRARVLGYRGVEAAFLERLHGGYEDTGRFHGDRP